MAGFGPGRADTPIILDDLACRGSELSLLNCSSSGLGSHDCLHIEDAGVICRRESYWCKKLSSCILEN